MLAVASARYPDTSCQAPIPDQPVGTPAAVIRGIAYKYSLMMVDISQ